MHGLPALLIAVALTGQVAPATSQTTTAAASPATNNAPRGEFITPADSNVAVDSPAGVNSPPEGVPAKVRRYARRLVAASDKNGNGQLDRDEWTAAYGKAAPADADGDSALTLDELAQYIADYGRRRRIRLMSPLVDQAKEYPPLLSPATPSDAGDAKAEDRPQDSVAGLSEEEPAERPSAEPRRFYIPGDRLAGLPPWFNQRDADGDGQLTLAEYSPEPSRGAIELFLALDRNADGVITAQECLQASSPARP